MLIMTLVSNNLNWSRPNSWENIINADAKGYYAYLPATLIYHDLNFGFFEAIENGKYYNEDGFYDYRSMHEGKYINKYYSGTAIAQAPFFIIAHSLTETLGYESDGYSKPYIISITIGSLLYLLFGLILISKLLKLFDIQGWNNAIVLIAFVFGSNLFSYSIIDIGMSHIYSFVFITLFLYQTKLYFNSPSARRIILISIITGFIVLIRPVNGLVIFAIPFLAGSKESLIAGFSNLVGRYKRATLLGLLLGVLVISIQLFIYKISTGSFFVFSYGEEGFNFLDPHIIDILFSYRKGLFLYTPIYLVSLLGLYFMYRNDKFQSLALIGFLALLIYILSSWWNWWYGGSFSSRVFVDFIPFFANQKKTQVGIAFQKTGPNRTEEGSPHSESRTL